MPLKIQLCWAERVYPHPDESCPVADSQNICQHPQVSHRHCNPLHRKLLFPQSILTLEKRERKRARLSPETLHFTVHTSLQLSSVNCPIVPALTIVNCPPNTASLIWLSMNCSYSTLCLFLSINLEKHHYCAQNLLSEEGGDRIPPSVQHMSDPLLRENRELPNRWSTDNDDINFPGLLLNAPSNDGASRANVPV